MLKNLINRHDLYYLVNGLRTGSIWRTLKRLVRGSESAVKATWQHVERAMLRTNDSDVILCASVVPFAETVTRPKGDSFAKLANARIH